MARFSDKMMRLMLTSSAAAVMASMAHSQEPAAPETEDETAVLNTVMVTARKKQESLIDVPVAITAIDDEALDIKGIADFDDLNDFVPGLRYQNSKANRNDRSFGTFSMRGMYPGDSPNRQGVTVFIDGVPVMNGAAPGMAGIQQVEVVKGPQSAYFGRSTFAGAVNFITAAPSLTETSGSVSLSYESFGTHTGTVNYETPIIEDVLGLRVGAQFYDTEGAYDNNGFPGRAGAQSTNAINASLNFEPSSNLQIRAFGAYWEDDDGAPAQALLAEDYYNCDPGGAATPVNGNIYYCGGVDFTPEQWISQNNVIGGLADYGALTDNGVLEDGFTDEFGLKREAFIANLQFDWDFIEGFNLAGNISRNENDWGVVTGTYNRPDPSFWRTIFLPYNMENTSAEIRFSSDTDSPFQYMLGVNYYDEDIFFGTRANVNGANLSFGSPTHYMAETLGYFGSASYDFGEVFTLSAEGRYQEDTIHHVVVGGYDLEDTFESFSPRVIGSWHVTPDADLYASYSSGTKPGVFNSYILSRSDYEVAQINAVVPVPLAVPEETITSYEIGYKGEMFDNRLRLLAAAYFMEWRDQQINQQVEYFATPDAEVLTNATVTLPAGKTDLFGIELEGAFQATDNLTLDGTFNWAGSDILYTNCSECVNITGDDNPVGNKVKKNPEFSGSLGGQYDFLLNAGWDGFFRADYIYTGKQYATEANLAWVEPSHRVNLKLGLRSDNGVGFDFYVRNLFDDDTPSNILRSTNRNTAPGLGLNTLILSAPEPRVFGVKVRYDF